MLLTAALVTFALGELVPGAVLYTRDNAGEWAATKLWVLDREGTTWIRVARPGSAWYRRLRVDPRIELERDGARATYRARPHPEPATRAAIDAAFREQNGAIDAWYALLLGRDAIPIELAPTHQELSP